MSKSERRRIIAQVREEAVTEWLDSLGVLCDCDNGKRIYGGLPVSPENRYEPTYDCEDCTLIEVGGIRVRARHLLSGGWGTADGWTRPALVLNGEEVAQ